VRGQGAGGRHAATIITCNEGVVGGAVGSDAVQASAHNNRARDVSVEVMFPGWLMETIRPSAWLVIRVALIVSSG